MSNVGSTKKGWGWYKNDWLCMFQKIQKFLFYEFRHFFGAFFHVTKSTEKPDLDDIIREPSGIFIGILGINTWPTRDVSSFLQFIFEPLFLITLNFKPFLWTLNHCWYKQTFLFVNVCLYKSTNEYDKLSDKTFK